MASSWRAVSKTEEKAVTGKAAPKGQLMWPHPCVQHGASSPAPPPQGSLSPSPETLPQPCLRNRAGAEPLAGSSVGRHVLADHLWVKLTGLMQTTDMGEAPWGAETPQHKGEEDLDAGHWEQVGRGH